MGYGPEREPNHSLARGHAQESRSNLAKPAPPRYLASSHSAARRPGERITAPLGSYGDALGRDAGFALRGPARDK